MTGGFHSSTWRSPRGAPLWLIAQTSAPISASACSFGLPIVAEHRMNFGSFPWNRQIRFSRRKTFARCEPKTPRYV
jgi:hypothetical protein